ncbi:phosphatidylserine decarboxylase [Flavobacterium rivuli WB 3.3-2 = DSM 21788]|uniref:Phosphatidylserine decarboxylase n=1 Tax=Flavobacterium rivuli WB 3.3-2 = DSM 21788 TaxID=1121895 RepID=A0A0A2M564_9FLAO|nr:acyl-CoA-binding protein [Flavobacterium rivuli]KGO86588.1 phosphatidylserine decarboxylase [Flavobacterium rivuli WB 3.3-2 = DSM 21788]
MPDKDLDTLFDEAFERASKMTEALPQDLMLRIYAYYKQATSGQGHVTTHHQSVNLRDAFKMNAWMQIRHLTPDEAKKLYIETIDSLTK